MGVWEISTPGETDEGQSVRLTPARREATRGTLAVNIGIGLIGHTVMTRRHADGAGITRLCCRFVPALKDKGAARQLGSSRNGTSRSECLTTPDARAALAADER
jgi:hypothetical protein